MTQNPDEVEKLYLPSRWSKRYPPEEIVDKHVEFSLKESSKACQIIPTELNIKYGELERERIDIFGTNLPKDAPIFVFVHGGYWQETALTRSTYHFIATNLYKIGVKSFFVGYELCPNVTLAKIIEEIETATKKCIDYAKEHKSKGLHIAGYSAGSHLVASLFTKIARNFHTQNRNIIKSAILIAGVYDLTQIPKTSINIPLKLTDYDAFNLSPLKQNISNDFTTLFYVIAAENDSPEFKQQSQAFHEKLKASGVNSTSVVIEKVDHFDIVENLIDENFELNKLFNKILL